MEMPQIKIQVTIPVDITPITQKSKSQLKIAANTQMAKRFIKKIARVCKKYGYEATIGKSEVVYDRQL